MNDHIHAIGRSQHRHAHAQGLAAHSHGGWELCLVVVGEVDWWVENEVWPLRAGHVYLTAPGEQHGSLHGVMQSCQLRWCQLDDALVGPIWQQLPQRSWHDGEQLASIFHSLLRECRRADQHSPAIIQALLMQLIPTVVRSCANAVAPQEPEPLRQIRLRIQHNPAWWPSIDELLQVAGCGRTHLFQCAARHWHEAPLAWLNRARIRSAQQQVRTSTKPLTTIALDYGYASSQHFSTAFRKICGVTPSYDRKYYQEDR